MSDQIPYNGKTVSPSVAAGNKLLQRSLFAGEMQVVMASLFGGVGEIALIPGAIASAIESSRAVQYVIARAGVDATTLLSKLDALPPSALLAIQDRINQFLNMSTSEMFGPDRVPSLATLGRPGLVKGHGHAAWGLTVVALSNWRTCELLLRQDPATTGICQLPYSLDDSCAGLVELIKSELDGEPVAKGQPIAIALAGLIALHTGWRYFRVEERNASAAVEIPRADLLGDLYRGQLGGLVLQGINAPEVRTGIYK